MLTITKLNKSWQGTPVLHDIQLTVAAASRTVIVGPSGSGKSTLLKLIAGFENPDSGDIVFENRPLTTANLVVPAYQRGIGYVPQDGMLFPHLTVRDNIAFALKGSRHEQDRQVAVLLDSVSLAQRYAQRWPHQLSGGQQQRVALARALALKPKLMLLDEPFSALDTGLRAATRDAVKQILGESGIACMMVTHDQGEALSFAQQLAVMQDGRLVQIGTPRELWQQPVDQQTAHMLGDAIILPLCQRETRWYCVLGEVMPLHPPGKTAACVMLRPEQLQIGTSTQPTGILLTDIAFAGDRSRLTVYLEAEQRSLSLQISSSQRLTPGNWLKVEIAQGVHLLPSSGLTSE
ncbi:ABC transporter ATP-binding protein [Erwinia tracheiphila]|uniref:ABC transporter ATP-binding protein n=1 Tax=Erwinia tracheiphila TaxID=65700 RepID=A0A345CUR7_9GAMM|nr:ABC transporter ATP-binding protein [Erwinia tracheiphila]AXF77184.1 ABC transporter ATP-binding protein [Erwinia tracheiphila]UIA84124.1 ABC transporter ATP-binding protein [Erwinia tracheiphila]UIA92705.1 ABC transporter ATP-binding protein [Erwinia tracheiphila]